MGLRLMSVLGLLGMVAVAWVCSENRPRAQWRVVVWGCVLQFALGVVILQSVAGKSFFTAVKGGFDVLSSASAAGAEIVFGNLTHVFIIDKVLEIGTDGRAVAQQNYLINGLIAFNALPVIIFVAGVAGILQHLGIVQAVVRGLAWCMRRTLKTSGAETFGVALLVFTGIESTTTLKGYLNDMTRSELFTICTAFLATIAASVMVAYAGFGAEPGHLLAASLMSAPAAIAIAKIMVPETGTPVTAGDDYRVDVPVESENLFDAAARGAGMGLNMALNVGAMLIVFIGLIYLGDLLCSTLTHMKLNALLGYFFQPFALIMGVPWSDVPKVGELLATKTVFNEFIAYQNMQALIKAGALSPRSATIATYALCGFANPGSLGIMIGGIASLAPERRAEVAQMSLRALVAGTLASFMTACIAGMLIP